MFRAAADHPWQDLRACVLATCLLNARDKALRLATVAIAEYRNRRMDPYTADIANDMADSLVEMKECIASGDRRCVIESFQAAEELAVFPRERVDEWSK